MDDRTDGRPTKGRASPVETFDVRRSSAVLALAGLCAAALAAAYGVRAAQGVPVLWAVVVLLALVTVGGAWGWIDARSPLLVADGLGVRLRHGRQWKGLPWSEVREVLVRTPAHPWSDGLLEVVGEDGTGYVVPLGLATSVSSDDVEAAIAALAGGDVAVRAPELDIVDEEPDVAADAAAGDEGEPGPVAPSLVAVAPVREAVRAEIVREIHTSVGSTALKPVSVELPERVELTRPAPELDDVPDTLGARIAHAREVSGITVESLSERTQIRSHVLESLERDDFGPCGGDFYARGHLRTVAKVLGMPEEPLVEEFDSHHAQAPIGARQVFQAEMATGARPAVRLARGGPNWGALLGVVMILAIIWGIGQYFTSSGEDPATTPVEPGAATSGSSAAAADPGKPGPLAALGAPTSNELVLRGKAPGTRVVVRSEDGNVVWKGTVGDNETKRLTVSGRASLRAKPGNGLKVRVNGNQRGLWGEQDGPATAPIGRR